MLLKLGIIITFKSENISFKDNKSLLFSSFKFILKGNYEKLGVYVSKSIQILFERQCVDEKVIQILGREIITLCKSNIDLNAKVDALTSRVDHITNSLLLVTALKQ